MPTESSAGQPTLPDPPGGAAGRAARGDPPAPSRLQRAGRVCWALLGMAGVLAVAGYVASLLSIVVVPVVLALFPATLLVPLAGWMRKGGAPSALAAVATIVAAIATIALLVGAMVPVVAAEVPGLADSAADGMAEIEQWLADGPFGVEVGGLSDVLSMAQQQVGEMGDVAGDALSAATTAFEVIVGGVLMVVVLFFYLKDGRELTDGIVSLLPAHLQPRAHGIAMRSWETLGKYFRGQLLVALVDAVFIGLGLLLLGVPLALPLAVLIFFGGLFPIVGAVVTGALAVLVALADGGLTAGLLVTALIVAVQQLESNVLGPYILGRAIALHPIVVLLSITAGGVLLGVLGAFLAVPLAAIVARSVRYVRDEPADAGEAGSRAGSVPAPATEASGERPQASAT